MQTVNFSSEQFKTVIKDAFTEAGVATKSDLKDFAKKSDLKDFATKSDLDALKNDTNSIKAVIKTLATKKDLQKIDKKFDKFFNYLDKDYLKVKRDVRDVQYHLHLPVSDF